MATREQAMLIGRNQRIAKQRQAIMAAIESGEIPMDSIMDPRLPLTDRERQNAWNQMAANQWSGRQAALRGESLTPSGSAVNEFGGITQPFSGTPNQMRMSLNMLQRSPEWQQMDETSRAKVLQRIYGTEVASTYISGLKDREAIEGQRRKTFDDAYETERVIAREKRQSQSRLASTEPEMLHRNIMSRDWVVRPNGVFERNPEYNPSNPLTAELPPYLPASSATEATVARHWTDVMPGRANPLSPEKLMAIKIAEENPDLSTEDILKTTQARLAALASVKANPARAIVDMDEANALARIGQRQAAIPSAFAPAYNVERTSPTSSTSIPTVLNTPEAELRFGQKLRMMGANAVRDVAGILPAIESRITNVGQQIERNPTFGVDQFLRDLFGGGTVNRPAPVVPISSTGTESYKALPDWLK